MKSATTLVVCFAAAFAPAAMAQKWEFGGGVGGGFYTSQDVTSSVGSAAAKLTSNLAGSVWLANNSSGRWGGEIRADYQLGDLSLNSGGTTATFGARTYALHYDILWHAAPAGSKIRPFVAFGAGIKVFQGTGAQVVYQPLSNFALLTQQQDLTPMASAGGGVKVQLTPHLQLRAEIHDYLTPFPKKVITPSSNAKVGGWLQDFVPMIGISYTPAEAR
jgi:Outer membrane protein beta-barrel domain